jgi:alanine racemase
MSLVLTVRRDAWYRHVETTLHAYGGPDAVIPVVKGNGYGFGRSGLLRRVRELMGDGPGGGFGPAVGTVHEAAGFAGVLSPLMVLTPEIGVLPPHLPADTILTVGRVEHVANLARQGWEGPVVVKLQSSMRRYGTSPGELHALVAALRGARCPVVGFSLHLPLAGDDTARMAEVTAWLPHLDPHIPVAVSHMEPDSFQRLCEQSALRTWRIRLGTRLWHGDKSMLYLGATVADRHPVHTGDRLGYQLTPSPVTGQVIAVAAGSAHGIAPHANGASPLHFARRRLVLLEAPHMHTTLAVVPSGDPCPDIGDQVDVQCPLTRVDVDEVSWLGEPDEAHANQQLPPR